LWGCCCWSLRTLELVLDRQTFSRIEEGKPLSEEGFAYRQSQDLGLWRFDGWAEHDRGHIFLQRLEVRYPMGRPASRLSERAGTPVHPRQRADVARGTPR
jgi:hypothetical protein